MPRLTDTLQALEWDLAKYPGSSASDLLNRRLVLRRAFDAHGRERYEDGYRDGMRDVNDTRHEAERLTEDKAAPGGDESDDA